MPVNDRREIFGWAMYDWANSGFQVTVLTVMSGPYLTALAQQDVGENGVILSLIVLFLAGMIGLFLTDTDRAVRDAAVTELLAPSV